MIVPVVTDQEYTRAIDRAYVVRGRAILEALSPVFSADMGEPVRAAMARFNQRGPQIEHKFQAALGEARDQLAQRAEDQF